MGRRLKDTREQGKEGGREGKDVILPLNACTTPAGREEENRHVKIILAIRPRCTQYSWFDSVGEDSQNGRGGKERSKRKREQKENNLAGKKI